MNLLFKVILTCLLLINQSIPKKIYWIDWLVLLEITLAFCRRVYQHVYVLSIRVFLRAINTYAETMNQKFLNNDDFEVQVPFLQALSYVIYSVILLFSYSSA